MQLVAAAASHLVREHEIGRLGPGGALGKPRRGQLEGLCFPLVRRVVCRDPQPRAFWWCAGRRQRRHDAPPQVALLIAPALVLPRYAETAAAARRPALGQLQPVPRVLLVVLLGTRAQSGQIDRDGLAARRRAARARAAASLGQRLDGVCSCLRASDAADALRAARRRRIADARLRDMLAPTELLEHVRIWDEDSNQEADQPSHDSGDGDTDGHVRDEA